jgi:hypothetical protein
MSGPLDHLLPDAAAESLRRVPGRLSSGLRFEHRVVAAVAARFALDLPAIARLSSAGSPTAFLSLAGFRKAHPDFPCRLFARRVPYVFELTVADLVKGITKTKLYKELAAGELETDDPEGPPVALAFEWVGVWPLACLHGGPVRPAPDEATLVLRYDPERPHRSLTLRGLNGYLATLPWRRHGV